MKYILFIMIVLLFFLACTTSQPAPISTPLPPTEPPPPTATSVPPTQAPNPHAEEVLLASAEAFNNREYEKVKTFFSENVTIIDDFNITEGLEELESLFEVAEQFEDFELSEFVTNGNSVEFKWFFKNENHTWMCDGYATMEEDKIIYLEMTACEAIS
ncbi:MAG: nuclear transport factor 2 family protein [Anaerolineales bacterium]